MVARRKALLGGCGCGWALWGRAARRSTPKASAAAAGGGALCARPVDEASAWPRAGGLGVVVAPPGAAAAGPAAAAAGRADGADTLAVDAAGVEAAADAGALR